MSDQSWVPPGSPAGEPARDPVVPGPPPGSAPPPPGQPATGSPYGPPPGQPYGTPPGQPDGAPPGQPYGPPGAAGQAPPPWARMDVRPGIVPLRPLTLGDLYNAVFAAVRGNPGATIGLAALTSFVFLLPTTALGAVISGRSSFDPLSESQLASDTAPDGFGLGILGMYLPSIGQFLSTILLTGFLAFVVGQAVLGRKVSMGQTWGGVRGRILPLVGVTLVTILAAILVAAVLLGIPIALAVYASNAGSGGIGTTVLLIGIGVLLWIVAAVVLYTKWAFATAAIVLDRVGVLRSLGRSWSLVGGVLTGSFWRIFGIRLLTGILVGIAGWIIVLPITLGLTLVAGLALGDGGDPTGSTLLVVQTLAAGVAGLLTGALTTPFSAGVDALLYVDARIRREGLDVRLIQSTQGAAEPPWPVVG